MIAGGLMSGNALIIVDMLNDFVDEKGTLYRGENAGSSVAFIRYRLIKFIESKVLVICLYGAEIS